MADLDRFRNAANVFSAMPTSQDAQPAGYQALIDKFGLTVMPLAVASFVRRQGGLRIESASGQMVHYYPASYAPGPATTAHLEFALKYDGVNLEVLRAVFEQV